MEFVLKNQKPLSIASIVRVAIMNSGGKDSASAWWWATCRGWEISHIVTVKVRGDDSHMFQIPGIEISKVQANITGVPYHEVTVTGKENLEVNELKQQIAELQIDGLVVGALRSDYQKSRLERMTEELGLRLWTPLWHQSGEHHVRQMIENSFSIMISSVSCDGLDDSWLGRILTLNDFEQLKGLSEKYRFHIDGEGGEYETIVLDGPHLLQKIDVTYEQHWDGRRGSIKILEYSI